MRMTEPEIGLDEAISAYRDGKRGEALRISRAILVGEPENAGAHYVLGIAQADAGEPAEAILALQRAVSLAPENVSFHITLGNLYLMLERDAAAARAFRQALFVAPGSAPAHANLATTLKRQGRLEEAVTEFRTALDLLRGSTWYRPCTTGALTDPSQDETFCFASRAKLTHDIEQYEYLLARDALPSAFEREIAAHRDVLDELNEAEGGREPARRRALSSDQQARLAGSFNRLNYLPPDTNSATEVLNPALDYGSFARQFGAAVPPVIIVDDLLSEMALAALRRFCLEATIWFDCKEHGGYLGAYMNEGFDIPLLFDLARQLQKRLPNIFGGHKLVQMWAFKYGARSPGTRLHADKAAVNLNFWITPDSALENKEFGGLRLYDMAAPPQWRFEDYNLQESALRAEIKRRDVPFRDIPYKCNRAAIFDSSLIHETIPLRFQDGYENRRINVTMLFGERAEV
jgi:hypothetical protein